MFMQLVMISYLHSSFSLTSFITSQVILGLLLCVLKLVVFKNISAVTQTCGLDKKTFKMIKTYSPFVLVCDEYFIKIFIMHFQIDFICLMKGYVVKRDALSVSGSILSSHTRTLHVKCTHTKDRYFM